MKIYASVCIIAVSFVCISLTGCQAERVEVTGIAKNEGDMAFVMTAESEFYFLKKLHHWDAKYLDQKVKVSGVPKLIRYDTSKFYLPGGDSIVHIRGRFYLLKPKWELVQ